VQPKLYMMCGVPGCGKTTWIQNHLTDKDVHISRDEIRFEILEPNDEYFKHEDFVFKRFCEEINWGLRSGFNVFADATHITKNSRQKLLRRITENVPVAAIFIKTPLEQAIAQNELREGRSLVPLEVIQNMYKNLQPPTLEEGFDEIFIIEINKPIKVLKRGD